MSDYMVSESSGPAAIRYRSTVVWIHWITATLLIAQVVLGFYFSDLPRGPDRMEVFAWHKTLGAIILLLAFARLGVRLVNPPPPYPQDFPRWERAMAVWNHRIFYILLIALPLTGLLAVSGRAEDDWVALKFGLALPAIPGVPKENEFGDVHEVLVFITIGLLVLHVGAALKNQFADRGPVASRMPPFRASRPAGPPTEH
ncbi:cytochrome b [Sphingomonas sp. HDW15A]|uniref:cytochrome b n=1 Tax=Sphingomonas sp. HDW15A TaxID=2714942 RepID=UPI00140AC3A2|nr:cytochrome b [Sphingomonas sp. HDW15A]QIK96492.1 cytochrome b [Sphingomonas sp. HDW15A]